MKANTLRLYIQNEFCFASSPLDLIKLKSTSYRCKHSVLTSREYPFLGQASLTTEALKNKPELTTTERDMFKMHGPLSRLSEICLSFNSAYTNMMRSIY